MDGNRCGSIQCADRAWGCEYLLPAATRCARRSGEKAVIDPCLLHLSIGFRSGAELPPVLDGHAEAPETVVRWATYCSTFTQYNLCAIHHLRTAVQQPDDDTNVEEPLKDNLKFKTKQLTTDTQAQRPGTTPTPGAAQLSAAGGAQTTSNAKQTTECTITCSSVTFHRLSYLHA